MSRDPSTAPEEWLPSGPERHEVQDGFDVVFLPVLGDMVSVLGK